MWDEPPREGRGRDPYRTSGGRLLHCDVPPRVEYEPRQGHRRTFAPRGTPVLDTYGTIDIPEAFRLGFGGEARPSNNVPPFGGESKSGGSSRVHGKGSLVPKQSVVLAVEEATRPSSHAGGNLTPYGMGSLRKPRPHPGDDSLIPDGPGPESKGRQEGRDTV